MLVGTKPIVLCLLMYRYVEPQSLAFWLKDSSPLMTTAYDVADFAKYPVEIYARPIRIVLMTILPFAFVAYIPSTFS